MTGAVHSLLIGIKDVVNTKSVLLLAATCFSLPVAAWAQVAGKTACVISGKTYYQNGSCPAGAIEVPSEAEKEVAARHKLLCPGPDAPRIGMSESDLKCLGSYNYPRKINITETARGTLKQYVYDTNGGEYLYFTNGVLTSMQGQQR